MKVNHEKVIDGLKELSDADYQHRVWVLASTSEMSTYDEAICTLFDDSRLQNASNDSSPTIVYSREIDDRLLELENLVVDFSKIESKLPPNVAFNRPEIHSIRKLAAGILVMLADAKSQ